MKGIIMAGGYGNRLSPVTVAVSKALLPVYDRPMIYLPLSTLMKLDIREVMIICNERDHEDFTRLLGNGSQFGIKIEFRIQDEPRGIADAFNIARDFISDEGVALILGDNLIYREGINTTLFESMGPATIIGCLSDDPSKFGVIEFDETMNIIALEEKPLHPRSSWVAIGLYFYSKSVVDDVSLIAPSPNGELEITDLNRIYLQRGNLKAITMNDCKWMDMGAFESLLEASRFIHDEEQRIGRKILCPEIIAFEKGWVSLEQLRTWIPANGCSLYYKDVAKHVGLLP